MQRAARTRISSARAAAGVAGLSRNAWWGRRYSLAGASPLLQRGCWKTWGDVFFDQQRAGGSSNISQIACLSDDNLWDCDAVRQQDKGDGGKKRANQAGSEGGVSRSAVEAAEGAGGRLPW